MLKFRFDGLWRNPDFLRLWCAQGISDFGVNIMTLALPMTAAVVLHANSIQMGVMSAVSVLPYALFSLHAGVLIDRRRRMPLMLLRDVMSGAALLMVPIAAWGGWLCMPLLWLVGFSCVAGEAIGGSAHQSYVANLIGKDKLVEAHSKFMTTASTAQLVAPGMAGLLIQWLGAPFALFFNAASYFISAIILRTIKVPESLPVRHDDLGIWQEIKAGMLLVWQTRVLRAFAIQTTLWQLLNYMSSAVLVLYATRELSLSAAQMGASYMLGGVGSLLAAVSAERLGEQYGVGPMVGRGFAATALGWLGFALIPGHVGYAMLLFSLSRAIFSFGTTMFSIHYLAARAAVTPDALMGRMISTMRFVTVAPAPLGALLGGMLGTVAGLRGSLWVIGGLAALLSCHAMWSSPARLLVRLPGRA